MPREPARSIAPSPRGHEVRTVDAKVAAARKAHAAAVRERCQNTNEAATSSSAVIASVKRLRETASAIG